MTINEILAGGGVVIVILTLIKITPIKIDPWSAFTRLIGRAIGAIGRAINKDVLDKVGALEKKMDTLEGKVDAMEQSDERREAVNARTRILRFGDEVLHHTKHTKDHFDQTLRDIDAYEQYCTTHPEFENNVTSQTSQRIEAVYRQCLEDGSFL